MSNQRDPQRTGRGRHRGDEKSEKDIRHEMQAKGNLPKAGKEQREQPGEEFVPKDRGHQRGFGKNQGREAGDRSTPHGTKAMGAEHG